MQPLLYFSKDTSAELETKKNKWKQDNKGIIDELFIKTLCKKGCPDWINSFAFYVIWSPRRRGEEKCESFHAD